MSPRTTKKARLSHSTLAGIIFPVTRIHRHLKIGQSAVTRITKSAAVYLASVVEYLVVLELSVNAAQDNRRTRITPRHVLLAVACDQQLDKLLHNCLIPGSGVLPSIHPFLVKKCGIGDNQDKPSPSIISSTRTKQTAVFNSTAKIAACKPDLAKSGLGRSGVPSTPKSKAVARKRSAVRKRSERVLVRKHKLNTVKRNTNNVIIHRSNKSLHMSEQVALSFNQPRFSPTATWNKNGITLTNRTIISLNHRAIFINFNNTVYIPHRDNNQLSVWFDDNIHPTKSISGNFSNPSSIFVRNNGDIYINNDQPTPRVNKWISNANIFVNVMNVNSSCFSLFVDRNDTLYCSVYSGNQIVKRWLNDVDMIPPIAAGTNNGGSASNELMEPTGIFVDEW